jgi:hypothetical protein
MTKHLCLFGLALGLLPGAEPQQPRPNTVRPIPYIIPLQKPNTDPPPPKPQPPKTGITAPKRTDSDRSKAYPSVPVSARADEGLDVPDWTKVSPDAAGFAVSMPEEPREHRQKVRAGNAEIDLTRYVVSLDDNKGAYLVVYSELPGAGGSNQAARQRDEESIFRAARDRVVDDLKGQLLHETRVLLGTATGSEIQVRAPGGTVVRDRMFVVGRRFYQVMVAGPREFVSSPEADQYFRSFRLTPQGE